jgi:hypothetical protein
VHLECVTGYKIGGVSAFGQKRKLPTGIETEALSEPYVYVNGGRRGLQLRLNPGGGSTSDPSRCRCGVRLRSRPNTFCRSSACWMDG